VIRPVTFAELERDDQGIILMWARLDGHNGSRDLQLAFDTGAAMTLVVPEVLDHLGYSARDGDQQRQRGARAGLQAPSASLSKRSGSGPTFSVSTHMTVQIMASMACSAWTSWRTSI
jgi:hypothetical protein